MAKNPSEIPPQTSPPTDTGKEEARKLYEEEIAQLNDMLTKTRERMEVQRGKKGLTEAHLMILKDLENQIAQKEYDMRQLLSGQPTRVKEEVTSNMEELRRREHERRAQKEAKKQKKKEERGKGKGVSLEELRKKQFPQAPEEQKEEPKKKEELKNPWEDEETIAVQMRENEEKVFSEENKIPPEELKFLIKQAKRKFEKKMREWRMLQPILPHGAPIEKQESIMDSLNRESLKCQLEISEEKDPEKIQTLKRKLAISDLKWQDQQNVLMHLLEARKLEGMKEDLEKGSQEAWAPKEEAQEEEGQERFEILEVPEVELAPRSQATAPPDKAPLREKKESLRAQKERMLKTAVENLARNYEEARSNEEKLKRALEGAMYLRAALEAGDFQDVRDTDDGRKAERLYREISDTMRNLQNRKAAKVKVSAPSMPPQEAPQPPARGTIPEQEPQKPQTPIEAGPLTGQTREERIAAFRARREELAKKEAGKRPYEISQELAHFDTAEHYHFDTKEIDKAIEEAKQTQTRGERSYQNKVKTVEMLERVKALIEKEIGVEVHEIESRKESEPLAEKTGEDIIEVIEDMKSPEGVPAPESEPKKKEKESEAEKAAKKWEAAFAESEKEKREEMEREATAKSWEEALRSVGQQTQPEQMRDGIKITPETRRAFEELAGKKSAQAEEQPAAGIPLFPEGHAQESPEMKAAIEELLGGREESLYEEAGAGAIAPEMEGLWRDERMRESAHAVVEARRAMRDALATRKEELLYTEAGAGFIAPEKLQEAEQREKAYEDALVGLSARLRESAGNNAEAFLVPYLNIQNAEAMRIAQMREAALTPERGRTVQLLSRVLNNPFNQEVPSRYARYVRVGVTAAVLGGATAALGGMGAAGIAAYAGWRMSKSLAFAAANGLARFGIDVALTRHADTMMGKEKGRQRTEIQEALRNNERVEALQESLRASIHGFQNEAAAQLENRKFYGRAATFGLMGLSGLISYELARPSAVAADEGAFGSHIATNEDVLRQRFYETTGNMKEWGEETASSVMARARELYDSGLSYGKSLTKSAEEAAADMQARGKLGIPGLWEVERPKEYIGGMPVPPEGPPAGGAAGVAGKAPLGGAPGTSAVGPSPEDIAKLGKVVEEAEKTAAAGEPIATIGKGGNIWEASRGLIGEGEGKISKKQWLEAWENSKDLHDKGLVFKGHQVLYAESAEGPKFLLRDFGKEAGTNDDLWNALIKEGKIKAGEPAPPQYQWLEKARGIEHHAPSGGEQAAHAAALAEARPAMTKETFEEMMRERAAGGATLKEFLGNHDAYMKDFESASLSDQEAAIADIERGFEHVHRAAQLQTMYQPEIRDELLGLEKQAGLLLKDLQDNSAYLEHVKAWGTFKHAWEVDGGFTGGKERLFDQMMNRWTVDKYLDTVRKMEKGLFEPRVGDSLEQHIDIHRNGFLGLSQEVMKKINEEKPPLNANLGRFLKNTL